MKVKQFFIREWFKKGILSIQDLLGNTGRPMSHVMGLHAFQFGNKWMRKIPRTAKIGRGRQGHFFNPIISKLDSDVVLLHCKC